MTATAERIIVVAGATGLQGGAVTLRLLREGWRVRALTRRPDRRRARRLAALGAEVVQGDMADVRSLHAAFDGAHGVFSVQNHRSGGYAAEVAQGRNVGDSALRAGVRHVVYSAAGPGEPATGVGSWDTKVEVIGHLQALGLPLTVVRPMAFMELMTARKFFPAASTWSVMPRLLGPGRPVGWVAVDDLAAVVALAFADPNRFVGSDLPLVADVRSVEDCARAWRDVSGRSPVRLPMPTRVFERLAGTDETTMWRWLRDHEIDLSTDRTRVLLPHASTVPQWIRAHIRRSPPGSRAR